MKKKQWKNPNILEWKFKWKKLDWNMGLTRALLLLSSISTNMVSVLLYVFSWCLLWGWDLMFYWVWICFCICSFIFIFVLKWVCFHSTPLLEDLTFYWSNLEAFPVTSCGKYPCKDKYKIVNYVSLNFLFHFCIHNFSFSSNNSISSDIMCKISMQRQIILPTIFHSV